MRCLKNGVNVLLRLNAVVVVTYGLTASLATATAAKTAPKQSLKKPVRNAVSERDTMFYPIAPKVLQQAIVTAVKRKSPVALVQLLRRAQEQDQIAVALHTLDTLRSQQPNNALAISSYCLALQISLGWHSYGWFHDQRGPQRSRSHTADDMATMHSLLQKAMQLDPNLWLTYCLAGSKSFEGYKKGLPLLQKAVALAPNASFAQSRLGAAYISIGLRDWSNNKPHDDTFQKAAAALEKAVSLKPVSAESRISLFEIYNSWLKDGNKARRAAKLFVMSLPPGTQVDPTWRQMFAKHGVQIAWK